MADSDGQKPEKLTFKFLRGVEADAGELEWPAGADVVRKALSESLNAKNVAFLLDAGCSSYYAKETDILGDEEWVGGWHPNHCAARQGVHKGKGRRRSRVSDRR